MKTTTPDRTRLKACVRGAVQGVGFRPFIFRLASELGLTGWVNNSVQGVLLEVEGPRSQLERFLLRIEAERPPRSFISSLEASWLDAVGYTGFEIRESDSGGGKTVLILPDIATCLDCLAEILDPKNRRYRYPFTNCTNCGPRFSIIESLPYDRANTSMKKFRMCARCQAEYDDPRDRRFHAQPNACPECGPHLELWPGTCVREPAEEPRSAARGYDALVAAAEALRNGKIVAVKGLGGFHLMVDARQDEAVRRLRERKHREEKPLALMFPSLEAVRAVCEVSALEERLLRSPEAPIVLLRNLAPRTSHLAPSLAPGNPALGILLPYTPLHHLLMAELGFPVVATSGNLSDEPICIDEREAMDRLGGVADLFLVHNRPIVRHVDDSIVRVMMGRELVLRRARGYAPLPITINVPSFEFRVSGSKSPVAGQPGTRNPEPGTRNPKPESILAVGAHLKNTVALSVGPQVFLSQHIGDLETDAAFEAFRRVIADFERLYEATPSAVAADAHPDYLSTKFAQKMVVQASVPPGFGVPPLGGTMFRGPSREGQDEAPNLPAKAGTPNLPAKAGTPNLPAKAGTPNLPAGSPRYVSVQHHVAHVLSCMAENELAPPVLGVSWDGTGYGLDGTIWGGEFFRVTDATCDRIACLRPFPLPGGDKAVREPRRTALGLLYELFGDAAFEMKALAPVRGFRQAELVTLRRMLERGVNSPRTSSIGRLFDAVAALAGLRQRTRFEGQTAMELEFALEGFETEETYAFPIADCRSPNEKPAPQSASLNPQPPMHADWGPMLEAILADLQRGLPAGQISAKFHNALAEVIVAMAQRVGETRVVLSGGCFQNRYLTERSVRRLRDEGFRPYWHQRVPPNDGGIALGQIVAALSR